MKIFKFLHHVLKRYPLNMGLTVSIMILVGIVEATSLVTLAPVADFLLHPNLQGAGELTVKLVGLLKQLGLPVSLWTLIGVFLVMNVLKNGCQIAAQYAVILTNNIIYTDMMMGTYRDLLGAKWQFFVSDNRGAILNTFTREMNIAGRAFLEIGLFMVDFVLLIFCLVVPLLISWKVTLIGIVANAAFALPLLLLGRLNYRLGQQTTATSNHMTGTLQESLSSAKVILGFGNQQQSIDRLDATLKAFCKAYLKSSVLRPAVSYLYVPCGLLAAMIALYAAERIGLPLSEVAVILYALVRCVPYVSGLTQRKNTLDNFFPSFEQVLELQARAQRSRQKTGKKIFTGFKREITLEDLDFSYPGGPSVLKGINATIAKGKMIAFVGESGAGKSTLIDVILGFNEPTRGAVRVDGLSLYEYDILSYRQRIGYVPQDSPLFDTSIRENLNWAKPNATEKEFREACRKANAEEFIDNLPHGLDTLVGDRGVRLSGGQCQRIALARAMLRRPDLLILDEATSALDSHSERLIQQAIASIARHTTVIVIAHRLSTITAADYIHVLEDGRIVEEGMYQDLCNRNGRFATMVKLQFLTI